LQSAAKCGILNATLATDWQQGVPYSAFPVGQGIMKISDMQRKLLLRTQRDEVFLAVQKRGFNPSDFVWQERESAWQQFLRINVLSHHPTGHSFGFDFYEGQHIAAMSPGSNSWEENVVPVPRDWPGQLKLVHQWLILLRKEVEAPDLWASISQEKMLVQLASNREADQTPFSESERKQIIVGLTEIKTYLLTAEKFNEEQAEFVRRRFDYLEGALQRLDRQAWLHTAIGVLFTITVGVGMAPDVAREHMRMAGIMLSQFFKAVPLPIP
jgi:hypothetical protein